MAIQEFLREKSDKTIAALEGFLAEREGIPARLKEAMAYSLFAGGKRLRPALALGAAELLSGEDRGALPAACAVEMVHTYSLIHDDLPCMDNDDMRRGKPTCHRAFGEATALLAGDALLTLAFEAASTCRDPRIVGELARAAGAAGMVGGQHLDLASEGQALDLPGLQRIHALKTGALIQGSVRCGAILGGADEAALAALTKYGRKIGLAFQIADDILNVEGDAEALGKPVGSDAYKDKATYPALLGLEAAKEAAATAVYEAKTALEPFGKQAAMFKALADYIAYRNN